MKAQPQNGNICCDRQEMLCGIQSNARTLLLCVCTPQCLCWHRTRADTPQEWPRLCSELINTESQQGRESCSHIWQSSQGVQKSATGLLLNNHCPPITGIEQHRTHRSSAPVFWPNSPLLLTLHTWCSIPRLAADTRGVQSTGHVKDNEAGGIGGEGAREEHEKVLQTH